LNPTAPAVALTAIVKKFGRVTALDGASLTVRHGSVHALLGENGAGKTTLMRIAFGIVHPDSGYLEVNGRRSTWQSPADAIAARIGMVHQHFTLVPAMTVAENVELGAGLDAGWRFEQQAARERVHRLSRMSGLSADPDTFVADLSVAAQQRVEILKALARDARLLILDEPTAVLAPRETEELLVWLRGFADLGGTVILITHKLREALAIADDITVLRRGRTVLAAKRVEVDARSLAQAMIGDVRDRDAAATRTAGDKHVPVGPPVLVLESVVAHDPTRRETIRAEFTVHAGEIIGVAGVEGAGQHALLRVLAGRLRPTAGRLTKPADVAFIPEDRHRDGLVLDFTLAENVALRGAGERRGLMRWPSVLQRTAMLMDQYDVRAPDPKTRTRTLSGGNQQRLVLARELAERPSLVVAENPTRGLDVQATADVHERLHQARASGTAVVFYSSDLDEVLTLASRVIAAHAGFTREVVPEKELVGRAILGLP
jgi:ABC-type uncharacterized transport system ATPase subunit